MSVILFVGILDEEFHRLWIQVIHIGVSRVHTTEHHYLPWAVTRGWCPYQPTLRDVTAQAHRGLLHGTVCGYGHHAAIHAVEVKGEFLEWIGRIFCLVQPLDGHSRMVVPEARHTISIDASHTAAGESVLVI